VRATSSGETTEVQALISIRWIPARQGRKGEIIPRISSSN